MLVFSFKVGRGSARCLSLISKKSAELTSDACHAQNTRTSAHNCTHLRLHAHTLLTRAHTPNINIAHTLHMHIHLHILAYHIYTTTHRTYTCYTRIHVHLINVHANNMHIHLHVLACTYTSYTRTYTSYTCNTLHIIVIQSHQRMRICTYT